MIHTRSSSKRRGSSRPSSDSTASSGAQPGQLVGEEALGGGVAAVHHLPRVGALARHPLRAASTSTSPGLPASRIGRAPRRSRRSIGSAAVRRSRVLTRELLVLDAVRLVGGGAELLVAPLLVLAEVALEPAHLAVALEREHVRGDAVEEPAVVADDDGAAGEALEAVLERAQRVDVEVVGRLVEQQHVAAALEHLGEVHAVALAAGQVADALLLVGALEVEAGDVRPPVDLAVADLHVVDAAGDLLVDGGVGVEGVAATGRRSSAAPCRRS